MIVHDDDVQLNPRWYVFQTGGNQEFFVERQLNRKKFVTWIPSETVDKKRMGVIIGQERRALFRSYGFVRLDLSTDNWRPIASTYGVKRLFGATPDKPIPVPEGVIESLQCAVLGITEEHDIVVVPVEETPIPILVLEGMVEVLAGPMIGHVGILQSTSASRAQLLMHILGAQVPVTFKRINVRMVQDKGP